MKIWHVGASPSPQTVDGLNATVWLIAQEQALMSHSITLLLASPPDEYAQKIAKKTGIQLMHIPTNIWSYDMKKIELIVNSNKPDIVHMHSVFLPNLATLAKYLVRKKIPYVITPNAISSKLLKRGWFKKKIYSWLLEKPRFYQASAISSVTPKEEKAIRDFVPNFTGIIKCIPNPINPNQITENRWKGNLKAKKLVYMGRFDVLHKGIDILVEIARLLPSDIELHLYGTEDVKTLKWLKHLQSNLPSNIYFHSPIFDSNKAAILSEASLYIQMSRWEVFGISIAEAMYLGLPCAVASTVNFAELFDQHNLGIVLSPEPQTAANRIVEIFKQPAQMKHWSESAQSYARLHLLPTTIAKSYLNLYQEVIEQ
ncbi:glycosyltransferase family 4 protein [Calothrix sp. UHCC 0171]|uniref:glycosyltransferase family 4 protein n=1 Tax=Calothrix sp. UHCC 0171 TaxID=3110245 RepID=UPI002B1EF93E|nr:glycosyltransferase family 4 protein [Calothrix sp. UHCC 0171]MEA5573565.1 glycosyltransferase family 4 protein [Calothrix sp. UHCC 0171]